MSGQPPQQGPWYGPPSPPQGPPYGPPQGPRFGPPTPPARRRGWIVVAVVAVIAVAAGGSFAAIQLADGDDESSDTVEPTAPDDPGTSSDGPADPADPITTPVGTDLWESVPSDAEVSQATDSLEANGYACYDTAGPAMLNADEPVVVDGQPVLVRRCYLDPASGRDQEQIVSLQAAPDGSVNAVRVVVHAFLDKSDRRTSQWFAAALDGLTGTILEESEARQLASGQTPDIAWGTAALDVNPEGTSYNLELVAEGSDIQQIPSGTTELSIQDARANYTGQGFACDKQQGALRCEKAGRGYLLVALASDDPVRSLTLQAEFDSGMPESAYTPVFDHLMTEGLPFAFQDDWSSEIDTTIGTANLQKAHRFDLAGLHVALYPSTTASFETDFDQAYQVVVEGICATDC
jgi:hypothetical protein